ncbi:XRE family transcriptional regulator, partial [Glaesserella parasuis]|nr:XRE family transcriptional regulator [Glaesserella parasuis]
FFKTPINWFFQDCIPAEFTEKELKEIKKKKKWDNLSSIQKEAFITFLETLK